MQKALSPADGRYRKTLAVPDCFAAITLNVISMHITRHYELDRLLHWWDADDASTTIADLVAAIRSQELPQLPVLAWLLIEQVRRSGMHDAIDTAVLSDLGLILDRWEERHGLCDAAAPAGVLGQVLQVQDLHCLADLCTHLGQGWASGPWSRRGHRLECALHARLWDKDGYRDIDGRPADALTVPLLLDTPAERVDRIAAAAEDGCHAALAAGEQAVVRLVVEGLRRHGRHKGVSTADATT